MIHSLSGGVIKREEYLNFAKVQLPDGNIGLYTYDFLVNVGDKVFVKYLNRTVAGTVLMLMPNTLKRDAPLGAKHATSIISKIKV